MVEIKDIEYELGIEDDIPDVDPKAKKPTKLTEENEQKIFDVLRRGGSLSDAAGLIGVRRNALFVWIRKGREQKRGRWHNFAVGVDNARAEAKLRAIDAVTGAYDRDWKAAAHYLAVRDPDVWSDKKKVEVTGDIDAKVTIEYVNDWGASKVSDTDDGKV